MWSSEFTHCYSSRNPTKRPTRFPLQHWHVTQRVFPGATLLELVLSFLELTIVDPSQERRRCVSHPTGGSATDPRRLVAALGRFSDRGQEGSARCRGHDLLAVGTATGREAPDIAGAVRVPKLPHPQPFGIRIRHGGRGARRPGGFRTCARVDEWSCGCAMGQAIRTCTSSRT